MKKSETFIALWAAVAACGCMDLDLLDEMARVDGGADDDDSQNGGGDQSAGDNGGDDDQGGGGDNEPSGPPDTDSSDIEPPVIAAAECGSGETLVQQACVSIGPVSASFRFGTDEPAVVSISAKSGGSGGMVSEEWSTDHHGTLFGLAAGAETAFTVGVEDVNGNRAEIALDITGQGGPAVAITEVLADPRGAEPDQEFVEIANIGADAVDLGGWMIDDNGDMDGDLIPSGSMLEPGAVAVLVSASYNPSEGQDPSPDPSCGIIYLESSIGSNGLKNSAAESIELYDAAGALVSRYKGQTGAPKEGCSAVRLVAELPDGDELAWALDPSGSSTPGAAASLR